MQTLLHLIVLLLLVSLVISSLSTAVLMFFFLIAITKMVHVAEAFVFWLRAIMIKGQK